MSGCGLQNDKALATLFCLLVLWLGNFTRVRGGGVSMRVALESCLRLCCCFSGVWAPLTSLLGVLRGCKTAASAALSAGTAPADMDPWCALMESCKWRSASACRATSWFMLTMSCDSSGLHGAQIKDAILQVEQLFRAPTVAPIIGHVWSSIETVYKVQCGPAQEMRSTRKSLPSTGVPGTRLADSGSLLVSDCLMWLLGVPASPAAAFSCRRGG